MDNKIMRCPLCHSKSILIHKGTRDNEKIDVYKCYNCETKFLSDTLQRYDYESGCMHKSCDLIADLNIKERLHLSQPDDLRRYRMVKDICCQKNVLDFGCGFGGFLHYISGVAASCSGVELGKIERENLKNQGIRCYKAIEETNDKYDVITLFHVFEHLPNPKAWLNKLSNFLSSEGYLIIEVPNANDALLSLYESEKFADFTYWSAHLFLYTIKSLSMIVNEIGKYNILYAGQVQRYSIANHLMWLAKGLPGGGMVWSELDSEELNKEYVKKLQEKEICDTLFFILQLRK